MDIKRIMSRIGRAAKGYGGLSLATVALFIAIVFVLNTIVYGLAERFSWYAYTTEKYEHQIGDATEPYFATLDTEGRVARIRFCMTEDLLREDFANDLVYSTALQLENKYDFIEVDHINIYIDPEEVNQYRGLSTDPETGEETETNAISTQSVIIDNGDGTDFMVLRMSSFFELDANGSILAYKGEEVMAAMVHRVMTEDEKTVYFTVNHGERSSATFYNLLVCAGYKVAEIDLRANDVPEDAEILIISNPIYDFEKAEAGTGIVSEIDRLNSFLSDGGALYAMIDPLVGELTYLDELLSAWGLDRVRATVRDVSSSLTPDGLTLMTELGAGTASATRVSQRVSGATEASVVLRNAAPIALRANNDRGASVEALLRSSSGAAAYADGEKISSTGSYPLAALARQQGGGSVFLVSSIFLTAQDAIQTNGYANAEFLYALLEEVSGAAVPLGCSVLDFDVEQLEGLSMGVAHTYSLILVGIVPALIAAVGAVVCIRRKNR